MEFDNLNLFTSELCFYLTNLKCSCPLIRKHKANLGTCGDLSFPSNFEYWIKYLATNHVKTKSTFCVSSSTIFDYCFHCKNGSKVQEEDNVCDSTSWVLEDIVISSKSWSFVICKCTLQYNRVQVYLDRKYAFKTMLELILFTKPTYGRDHPNHKVVAVCSSVPEDDCELTLTELRIQLLRNTTSKLLEAAGFEVIDVCSDCSMCVHFTNKSTDELTGTCQRVLCGVVVNSRHGAKENSVKARDYIRQRCGDMQAMAGHKCMSDWEGFLSQLGNAAVKFDLLHVRPSHTVSLNVEAGSAANRETSSRGAAFVLYNCARLSAIQQQFEDKVKTGYYPPLIPFDQVDFALLSREEEWELLFVYLLGFPSVLHTCVEKICPNLLCRFVVDLSSCFSVYYRRVRILTEARSHLLPVMFARLYLLKAIQTVIHNALAILGISPMPRM